MNMNRILEELKSKIVSGNRLNKLIISHVETGLFLRHGDLVLLTACRRVQRRIYVLSNIHNIAFCENSEQFV